MHENNHISAMDIFDNFYANIAIFSALIAGLSIYAEHRRKNRKNLHKVGFMPWSFISVISIISVVSMSALAIKIG